MTTSLVAGDRWQLEEGTGNWALEEGTGGSWALENLTDLTNYLLHGSITNKFNTVDFAVLDPPTASLVLNAGINTTDPAWSGTVAAITTSDPVDLRNNHVVYSVTATNSNALPTDTAPFDLSDVPSAAPPFDYLLEDGSGHYLLESGTDWAPGALLLEGAYAQGYSHLSVQTNVIANAPNKTLGRAQVVAPGLRPGNQFSLTSLNQGYAAASFQITQVTTRWPALSGSPFFDIEFGDTPDTLAAWTLAHAAPVVPAITPQTLFPAGTSIWGKFSIGASTPAMGGGIVTLGSASFSVNPDPGHSLTCQVVGAIDCIAYAWDNYVGTPRRAVRATLSGGVYTGNWQELPGGWSGGPTTGYRATLDLSSSSGLALAAGTYTVSIQIDTQEYNQLQIFSGWAQVAIIQT